MKLFILALLFCGLALAQQGGNGCDANSNPKEAAVNVSTNTATTLVAFQGGIIHVCTVGFSDLTATSVTLQGSDGTALWANIQGLGAFDHSFYGTLTTRRAAAGSGVQIVFSIAPANPVGVFVTYYITQN